MAIELYPHNQKTYEKMTEMFKVNNRVGVVQPTGTGKSFLYLKWMEDHPQDRFAVLSPSTEIFTQLQEYAENSGAPELLDSVQMISYQALLRMSDEEVQAIHPDKMVLDEFHRTGAALWGPALQRLLDVNPNAQVIGASATPVRYLDDGKDMASELFDRNLAVEMTLGEAVRRDILPTPKYVPVWYDIDGKLDQYKRDISKIINKEERKDLEEKLDQLKRRLENAYGAEDIFRKHMPHDHGKFLVFCRDSEHLEEMKKTVPQWLAPVNQKVRSYVSISAQEDKDLQLQVFKEDKGEDAIKLLFTIDRLNEGLHVKGIDGVMMLRPTISPIIYLQQMGRALASGGKEPLIFDLVNNYQNVQVPMTNGEARNVFEFEFRNCAGSVIEVSNFRIFEDMMDFSSIFQPLESRLYLSFDGQWDKMYALLEQFLSEHNRFPKYFEQYYNLPLGRWFSRQRQLVQKKDISPERLAKLQEIGILDSTLSAQWERNFVLLEKFVSENNCLPVYNTQYHGVALGTWCNTQKMFAKKNKLSRERISKLQEIGLLDSTLISHWNQNFALLEKYVAENNQLPKYDTQYHGVALGTWCNTQKLLARQNKLSAERFAKLKGIGVLDGSRTDRWERNFLLLKQFIAENNCFPKNDDVYCGVAIGHWFSTQIYLARQNHPRISSDRLSKLQKIGVSFDFTKRNWESNFELLERFIAEHHRFPKQKEQYYGVNLGTWCSTQKVNYKNNKLSPERAEKLKGVGLLESKQLFKSSLSEQIDSASIRAVEPQTFGKSLAKGSKHER